MSETRSAPYSALASVYDLVMAHVDYDAWAGYVHALMLHHDADPRRILELGCGTGSIGLSLLSLVDAEYTGLDASAEMIEIASRKAESLGYSANWMVADFADFAVEAPFDVVLLLYDGLNYAADVEAVAALFRCALGALVPNGLLLVDQSTPANSENNAQYFNDSGGDGDLSYVRSSEYDAETKIHRTTFEIRQGGALHTEVHEQRAYRAQEVRGSLEQAGFRVEAAYDGFSFDEADETSERIQWIARAVNAT